MRKILAILSIVVAMTACSNGSTPEVKNDSTVVGDSLLIDSTLQPVDSFVIKSEKIQ